MAALTPRQIKEAKPSEMKLINQRKIKELWERIYNRKDKIIERNARGKATMGYRDVTEFSGDPKKAEAELRSFEDNALGTYRSKEADIFMIRVDGNICVAEAVKIGTSTPLWTCKEESPRTVLKIVYHQFPKDGPMNFNPEQSAREMEVKQLKETLLRKQAELDALAEDDANVVA